MSASFGLLSTGFWKGFAVTLRPYLFFVSGASGLAGMALAPDVGPAVLVMGAVVFHLTYGLGQALTDVFQVDTDALSSPYRPLVRGVVTRGQVLGVSLAGLVLCTSFFAVVNPWTLIPSGAAVLGLATYTPLKRRWWGGPWWNAWIVACLPVMGWLLAGGTLGDALTSGALLLLAAGVLSTYAVFVLLGYLKDVEADRATGYETFPVRFGRRPTVLASGIFLVVGAGASLAALAVAGEGGIGGIRAALLDPWTAAAGIALWVGGLALMVGAHLRAARVRRDRDAHPAIALSVDGFVALHLGEAAILEPGLALPAVALFAASVAILRLRPYRSQI